MPFIAILETATVGLAVCCLLLVGDSGTRTILYLISSLSSSVPVKKKNCWKTLYSLCWLPRSQSKRFGMGSQVSHVPLVRFSLRLLYKNSPIKRCANVSIYIYLVYTQLIGRSVISGLIGRRFKMGRRVETMLHFDSIDGIDSFDQSRLPFNRHSPRP
jgi:hypothetical protein